MKARFILTQHSRDVELMQSILKYLDCGTLSNISNNYLYLTISKLNNLKDIIVPLLQKYPLQGGKNLDYLLFCEVISLMKNKEHLTEEGLKKIIEIKDKMNI